MNNDSDYPTDEFGRPNGRNYTYRVPLNDEAGFYLASSHLKGRTDRLVTELKNHDGNDLTHIVIQSRDNKGPLEGMGEYQYSEQWERPFSFSRADWEVRRDSGGGCKIRGTITAFDEAGFELSVPFDSSVSLTLGEIREAADGNQEQLDRLNEEMQWVEQEAIEQHQDKVRQFQEDCDHEHFVKDDDAIYDSREAVGYCEDCGAELSEDERVVGGRTM